MFWSLLFSDVKQYDLSSTILSTAFLNRYRRVIFKLAVSTDKEASRHRVARANFLFLIALSVFLTLACLNGTDLCPLAPHSTGVLNHFTVSLGLSRKSIINFL